MIRSVLIRILWTTLSIVSLLGVLAFIWNIPQYMGYAIPSEFAKLPITLLILVAMIAGIGGTWSVRMKEYSEKKTDTPLQTGDLQ